MRQAASLISRRSVLSTTLAVVAGATVADPVRAEIASVIAEYERHGYYVTLVDGGIYTMFPEDGSTADHLDCHYRWRACVKHCRAETIAFLKETGRVAR